MINYVNKLMSSLLWFSEFICYDRGHSILLWHMSGDHVRGGEDLRSHRKERERYLYQGPIHLNRSMYSSPSTSMGNIIGNVILQKTGTSFYGSSIHTYNTSLIFCSVIAYHQLLSTSAVAI